MLSPYQHVIEADLRPNMLRFAVRINSRRVMPTISD